MAFGGVVRFSEVLRTASSHPEIKSGCLVDTSILFAASYTPDKFNRESEGLFEYLAELEIPIFTNVNIRLEFINNHRRVMIPEGLCDLLNIQGKNLDGALQAKLQSVYALLTQAKNQDKPYKFQEEQIQSWRRILRARKFGGKEAWLQFCADFLKGKVEAIWDETCKELGVNFFSLRGSDESEWLETALDWDDMASLVGEYGIGSSDAMITNLFLNSRFSSIVTADEGIAYVVSHRQPNGKFVIIPDSLNFSLA